MKDMSNSKIVFAFLLVATVVASCVHNPLITTDHTITGTDTGGIDTSFYTGIPCDPDTVYFQSDILPLLVSNCAIEGCHDVASHEEGIILSTYEYVMSSDVIEAGDASDSELYEKITDFGDDDIMPPPPNSPLTSAEINLLATWINQGAQNNYCSDCDTSSVSFSGTIFPIIDSYCTGCHDASTPSADMSLTTYADISFIAENGDLINSLNGSAGLVSMPYGSDELPQCLKDLIQAWIDNGYPND